MKNIYYSIVIPTHNRPHLISKVIEGFKYLKNAEIIIVENNSTKENKEKYKNINFPANVKLLHKDDITLLEARKIGFIHANGEYIFNIDDDDLVLPWFVNFLNQNIGKLRENVYKFPISYHRKYNKLSAAVFYNKITIKSLFKSVQFSSVLFKKEAIIDLDLWEKLTMGEDQFFFFKLFEFFPNQKFINIKSIHFNYFKEKVSLTRYNNNIKKLYPLFKVIHKLKYKDILITKHIRFSMQSKKIWFKSKEEYLQFLKKYMPIMNQKLKIMPLGWKIWFIWVKLTKRKYLK